MALEEGLALEESTHRHEKNETIAPEERCTPSGKVISLLRKCRITFAEMSNHSSAEVGTLLRKKSFVPPEEFIHSPRGSDMSGWTT